MLDALEQLLDNGDVTAAEICDWLGIPERTLTQLELREHLSDHQRDKVRSLANIIANANKALGDRERAYKWLRRPNRALGGAVPARLISNEVGFRQVEQILVRIEYGGVS